jgi:putative endonuclease
MLEERTLLMITYGYVYIMASSFKRLYIGFTTDIEGRVWRHKNHYYPDIFTARYKIDKLVYFERFTLVTRAIAREKELKGWLRVRKVALIVADNPDWVDLSADWGKPITLLDGSTWGEKS